MRNILLWILGSSIFFVPATCITKMLTSHVYLTFIPRGINIEGAVVSATYGNPWVIHTETDLNPSNAWFWSVHQTYFYCRTWGCLWKRSCSTIDRFYNIRDNNIVVMNNLLFTMYATRSKHSATFTALNNANHVVQALDL